jgi:hypothetical protein
MARCCASHNARFTPVLPAPLESQFTEIAETQPELLARRCAESDHNDSDHFCGRRRPRSINLSNNLWMLGEACV